MSSRWYTRHHALTTDIYAVSLKDFHPGVELGVKRLYVRMRACLPSACCKLLAGQVLLTGSKETAFNGRQTITVWEGGP